MKVILIFFSQAYYEAVINIMDRNNLKGLTYWDAVQGRGSKTSESYYGNRAQPTLNLVILTMAEGEEIDRFLEIPHNLDKGTGAQGLQTFVWNIEKTI